MNVLTRLWGFARDNAGLIAVAAIVGTQLGAGIAVDRMRDARDDALLRLDSAEAAAAASREVMVRVLGDHVRYFERRVVQVREIVADSVADELGSDPVLTGDVTVSVDAADVDTVGTSADSGTVRTADFDFREPPFWGTAHVRIPPDPDLPTLRLRVGIDPIPLGIDVGCRGEGPVRSAHAGVTAPEWAPVRVDSVTAEAGVCNPRMAEGQDPSWWDRHGRKVVGAGAFVLGWLAGR